MTRTLLRLALTALSVVAGSVASHGAQYAAAFLESGVGARGPGLGRAYAAAVTGPDAVFWNPAGLVGSPGIGLNATTAPLSLGRLHHSVAAAVNTRGDVAFGCAWVHAGVDDLVGRTGSGLPTGDIEDTENAFLVAVGAGRGRVSLGCALKVIDQRLDVPGWRRAGARGHGVDTGVQYQLTDRVTVAAAARNLGAALDWQVERSGTQSTNTSDPLERALTVGASVRPTGPVLVAVELTRGARTQVGVGSEWTLDDLATVRGGACGAPGDAASSITYSAGLSLRPMRTEALLLHYAFVTDQLGAGDRAVFGLSTSF